MVRLLLPSVVNVPPVLLNEAPRLSVLPVISKVPASIVPPPVKVTIPAVLVMESEVEIATAGVTVRSAAPVVINGPPDRVVVTDRSLVAEPSVKV